MGPGFVQDTSGPSVYNASPLSSRQRKIFMGASPVASIDRTSKKGNVKKTDIAFTCVLYATRQINSYLYFMKGIFLDDIFFCIFCWLCCFGYFSTKEKWCKQ